MKALPQYVWEKFFAESAQSLWRLWTEPALFAAWYGPDVATLVHEMDVRVGGQARIEMKWPGGQAQFQKFVYCDVAPGERLVWLQTVTDASWNSLKLPNWPQSLRAAVEIHREAGQNCLHFTWSPSGDVAAEEVEGFKAARLDMDAAWQSSLELFEDVLRTLARQGP